MVDFSLSDEERQIRDTVRSFIEKEVMPLEPEVLRNERAGRPGIDRAAIRDLQERARRSGFWGVLTPEEYGGMNLGPVMAAIIAMESGRTFVPFDFGGTADNILYFCNEEQKRKYLIPTIEGERVSCFAITWWPTRPEAVRIDSGWNCTAHRPAAASSIAITAPSGVVADTVNPPLTAGSNANSE